MLTSKTFNELAPNEEVVVQFGPRTVEIGRKQVEVDPKREVIMTKAGYESIDRDETGEAIHCPTVLLGTPKYKTVNDPLSATGKRQDYDIIPLAEVAETDNDTEEAIDAENERFAVEVEGMEKTSAEYKAAKKIHDANLKAIKK